MSEPYFRLRHGSYSRIPGPRPLFLVGSNPSVLLKFPARPWEVMEEMEKQFGPYAMVWLFNQPMLLLHDPKGMREVLETKMESFERDWPIRAFKPASIFDSEMLRNGSDWARKRKASFFNNEEFASWLDACFQPGQEYLRHRLRTVAPKETASFNQEVMRLAFDYMSFVIFGEEIGTRAFKGFDGLFTRTNLRVLTNLPILTPDFYALKRSWHQELKKAVHANEKRKGGHPLLLRLISHGKLPKDKLAYEIANYYAGGTYSIAAVLTNLMGDLTAHPDALSAARAAARAITGQPDYRKVEEALGIEAPLRETLRLRPPVSVLLRRVRAREVQIGEYTLKRGTGVAMGSGPLHLNEAHWPDAHCYDPSRWSAKVIEENPYGSDYFFPFGRGPRACIGSDLALFLLRTTFYTLLTETSLDFHVSSLAHEFKLGCMFPSGATGRLGR